MNRLDREKKKYARDFTLELTPLKVEVLSYILENGPCAARDATRMACGRLGLDYLEKVQNHRLFKELLESKLISCHREYRNVQVEGPQTLRAELTSHLESYRLLKHRILETDMADATATYIAAKAMHEQ